MKHNRYDGHIAGEFFFLPSVTVFVIFSLQILKELFHFIAIHDCDSPFYHYNISLYPNGYKYSTNLSSFKDHIK